MKATFVVENQVPFEFKSDKFEKAGVRLSMRETGTPGMTLIQFLNYDLTHQESNALGDLTGKSVTVNITKIAAIYNGVPSIVGSLTINK